MSRPARAEHGSTATRWPSLSSPLRPPLVVAATPWLLVVGALGAVAYVVDRGYRRRRALALRADWEHKTLIARRAGERPALPAGLGLMTPPTVSLGMGRN
ncbi:hypothetical protein [Mycolicibacter virginiensis]|uniref:hypothetical protein n=1 Tax=Mycolicibacter virginiensis TaxID=1795032 RepID=UPI00105737ED|nr:hypothetical protein [Mycolicibacter virginiensis]ULP49459.1 hypothetical protein MJO54_10720 [Mycolicibacter virginiensis]